jgi:hypothetical protein
MDGNKYEPTNINIEFVPFRSLEWDEDNLGTNSGTFTKINK